MVRRGTSAGRAVGWGLLLAVIGLLVGTRLGQMATGSLAGLGRGIVWGPTGISLGALAVSLRVTTNLAGLLGAALGALVALLRQG